jgi:hypothetical protein
MNQSEKASNYFDIAHFIGKALHGIATGKEFTVQDAKDATNAISAVGQLAMSEPSEKEVAELMKAFAEAIKSMLDATIPAKLGGWEGKIIVPDNFNDPIDFGDGT